MSALHSTHPMIGFFANAFARDEKKSAGPGMMSRLWSTLATWRNRAVMRHHLLAMNEHMLKDIGLTRADAQREVNKPFWER
ncbi:MAG TPA: DUF1127 domain-containing protein [Kiloniellales bacterium]|nr:DUF1127 domain-containing protein [Kiloniellales bacterium]